MQSLDYKRWQDLVDGREVTELSSTYRLAGSASLDDETEAAHLGLWNGLVHPGDLGGASHTNISEPAP
jgi:hypothetical protein